LSSLEELVLLGIFFVGIDFIEILVLKDKSTGRLGKGKVYTTSPSKPSS